MSETLEQDDFWNHFMCEGLCGKVITVRIDEWGKYSGILNRHVFAELKRDRPDLVHCHECYQRTVAVRDGRT